MKPEPNNQPDDNAQAIRADLIGSTTATAAGIRAHGHAPVLALCRRLIAAGHHPASRLEVYRGAILALTVHSIGEGAQLDINSKGTGFIRRSDVRTAPPIAPIDPADIEGWIDWPATLDAEGGWS